MVRSSTTKSLSLTPRVCVLLPLLLLAAIVTNQPALALEAIQARVAKCRRSGPRVPLWSKLSPVVAV